jgi:MFS family permease
MCFNIGVIIGPILGGSLADPVNSFPQLFGPGSLLGGKEGVWWMQHWPYALPNVLSAVFILASFLAVFFGLDEVRSFLPDFISLISLLTSNPFRPMKSHVIERTGVANWESDLQEL